MGCFFISESPMKSEILAITYKDCISFHKHVILNDIARNF